METSELSTSLKSVLWSDIPLQDCKPEGSDNILLEDRSTESDVFPDNPTSGSPLRKPTTFRCDGIFGVEELIWPTNGDYSLDCQSSGFGEELFQELGAIKCSAAEQSSAQDQQRGKSGNGATCYPLNGASGRKIRMKRMVLRLRKVDCNQKEEQRHQNLDSCSWIDHTGKPFAEIRSYHGSDTDQAYHVKLSESIKSLQNALGSSVLCEDISDIPLLDNEQSAESPPTSEDEGDNLLITVERDPSFVFAAEANSPGDPMDEEDQDSDHDKQHGCPSHKESVDQLVPEIVVDVTNTSEGDCESHVEGGSCEKQTLKEEASKEKKTKKTKKCSQLDELDKVDGLSMPKKKKKRISMEQLLLQEPTIEMVEKFLRGELHSDKKRRKKRHKHGKRKHRHKHCNKALTTDVEEDNSGSTARNKRKERKFVKLEKENLKQGHLDDCIVKHATAKRPLADSHSVSSAKRPLLDCEIVEEPKKRKYVMVCSRTTQTIDNEDSTEILGKLKLGIVVYKKLIRCPVPMSETSTQTHEDSATTVGDSPPDHDFLLLSEEASNTISDDSNRSTPILSQIDQACDHPSIWIESNLTSYFESCARCLPVRTEVCSLLNRLMHLSSAWQTSLDSDATMKSIINQNKAVKFPSSIQDNLCSLQKLFVVLVRLNIEAVFWCQVYCLAVTMEELVQWASTDPDVSILHDSDLRSCQTTGVSTYILGSLLTNISKLLQSIRVEVTLDSDGTLPVDFKQAVHVCYYVTKYVRLFIGHGCVEPSLFLKQLTQGQESSEQAKKQAKETPVLRGDKTGLTIKDHLRECNEKLTKIRKNLESIKLSEKNCIFRGSDAESSRVRTHLNYTLEGVPAGDVKQMKTKLVPPVTKVNKGFNLLDSEAPIQRLHNRKRAVLSPTQSSYSDLKSKLFPNGVDVIKPSEELTKRAQESTHKGRLDITAAVSASRFTNVHNILVPNKNSVPKRTSNSDGLLGSLNPFNITAHLNHSYSSTSPPFPLTSPPTFSSAQPTPTAANSYLPAANNFTPSMCRTTPTQSSQSAPKPVSTVARTPSSEHPKPAAPVNVLMRVIQAQSSDGSLLKTHPLPPIDSSILPTLGVSSNPSSGVRAPPPPSYSASLSRGCAPGAVLRSPHSLLVTRNIPPRFQLCHSISSRPNYFITTAPSPASTIPLISSVSMAVSNTPSNVPVAISSTPSSVPKVLSNTPSSMPMTVSSAPSSIPMAVSNASSSVAMAVSNTPSNVPTVVSNTPSSVPMAVSNTPSNVPMAVSNTPSNVPMVVSNTPSSVPMAVSNTSSNVPTTVSHILSSAPMAVSSGPITDSSVPMAHSSLLPVHSTGPITHTDRPITHTSGPITCSNGPIVHASAYQPSTQFHHCPSHASPVATSIAENKPILNCKGQELKPPLKGQDPRLCQPLKASDKRPSSSAPPPRSSLNIPASHHLSNTLSRSRTSSKKVPLILKKCKKQSSNNNSNIQPLFQKEPSSKEEAGPHSISKECLDKLKALLNNIPLPKLPSSSPCTANKELNTAPSPGSPTQCTSRKHDSPGDHTPLSSTRSQSTLPTITTSSSSDKPFTATATASTSSEWITGAVTPRSPSRPANISNYLLVGESMGQPSTSPARSTTITTSKCITSSTSSTCSTCYVTTQESSLFTRLPVTIVSNPASGPPINTDMGKNKFITSTPQSSHCKTTATPTSYKNTATPTSCNTTATPTSCNTTATPTSCKNTATPTSCSVPDNSSSTPGNKFTLITIKSSTASLLPSLKYSSPSTSPISCTTSTGTFKLLPTSTPANSKLVTSATTPTSRKQVIATATPTSSKQATSTSGKQVTTTPTRSKQATPTSSKQTTATSTSDKQVTATSTSGKQATPTSTRSKQVTTKPTRSKQVTSTIIPKSNKPITAVPTSSKLVTSADTPTSSKLATPISSKLVTATPTSSKLVNSTDTPTPTGGAARTCSWPSTSVNTVTAVTIRPSITPTMSTITNSLSANVVVALDAEILSRLTNNLLLAINKIESRLVLMWTISTPLLGLQHLIKSYEVLYYKLLSKDSEPPTAFSRWCTLGRLDTLPLPMSVTLNNFNKDSSYAFAVKAVVLLSGIHVIYSNITHSNM